MTARTSWIVFLGFTVLSSASMAWAQKENLYVLTYKFRDGEKSRITTSYYSNFSTVSSVYNNASYGETAFDVLETIAATDEEGNCTMDLEIELTKKTVNGQNLTYKLGSLFSGDKIQIGVDRFGRLLENSAEYFPEKESKTALEEGVKTVRSIFIPLPDHPVKINEKWKFGSSGDTSTLALGWARDFHIADPRINAYYLLESMDQGIAKIALFLEMSGKGKIAEGSDSEVLEYAILATGSYYFDTKLGRLTSGSVNTQVVGTGTLHKQSIDINGSQTSSFNVEKTN